MKNEKLKQSGLVKMILVIVIALLALSYFNVDIRQIAESDAAKSNFGYVWGIVLYLWGLAKGFYLMYLQAPALWLWVLFMRIWSDPSVIALPPAQGL